jgi:hypothetical protein
MREEGEMQFGAPCLVVVHVLHELAMLAGGDAEDFGEGGAAQHDLLRHLR